MLPDPATCYRALSARDRRFDGLFFVAVTSTGIYCRPVCPARLPGRDRCRFFPHPGAAEAAGFRPCLRCRPERAPGRATVDARRNLAERAAARIGAGALDDGSVEELASDLFVGPRQLRRAVKREYGATPVQLAQTHRLLLAKQLLTETDLPVSRVAYAAGFSSLRRFNALFRERYRMSPTHLRRSGAVPRAPASGHPPPEAVHPGIQSGPTLTVALDYRPPLDWKALVRFLGARAIPGTEAVEGGALGHERYLRTVALGHHRGWIAAGPGSGRSPSLEVEISISLLPALAPLLPRIRHLFDLDADPAAIEAHLAPDLLLGRHVRRRPGLRIPGAVDGFELAWRAVLGQQVSVRGARTLAGRFAEAFGESPGHEVGGPPLPPGLLRFPVQAETVADASVGQIMEVGLPRSRAECLASLARAVAEGEVRLEPGADVEATPVRLREIRGIGPWTAQYIALRALHWPDAFPHGDLGLRKALGGALPRDVRRRAEAWRPWRGYAALHLWESLSTGSEPRAPVHPKRRRRSASP